jgi:hypothetical protein
MDVSNWQKLWDKGVDITANAISGAIVAIGALMTWRFQRWWSDRLDLNQEKSGIVAKLRRLRSEREMLALQAASDLRVSDIDPMQLERVSNWIVENKLDLFGRNGDILAVLQRKPMTVGEFLSCAFLLSEDRVAPPLAAMIRAITIPDSPDEYDRPNRADDSVGW